jgi:acetoin:2,6-dichlorophenolindophenol oxidoreductase subunit alpha
MSEERFCGPARRFEAAQGSTGEKLFAQMQLIRRFEEELLARFEEGQVAGTTHACIGQEADAPAVINHLREGDVVFSNHRCHGHFLAYSDRPDLLAAEVMGRATGLVKGRGGSQHICWENFYSNGIQGGIVPVALGMGLAERVCGRTGMAVVFLGDGTLGEGVVYEALNMASLWSAPVLFVVEDNRWAQSTPVEKELAGDMVARAKAFGIDAGEIESTDVEELYEHFGPLVDEVRRQGRPRMEVIHTYRLCHHSKSDDMRPREEVEARKAGDPLPLQRARLDEVAATEIEEAVEERIDRAFEWALNQPYPQPDSMSDPLAR